MALREGTAAESGQQFCVLEYSPRTVTPASQSAGLIVLLAVRDEGGDLHLFVRPDWVSRVNCEDRGYLDELIRDFIERAHFQPRAFYEHISSLASGPLLACKVGARIEDHPEYAALCASFQRLS